MSLHAGQEKKLLQGPVIAKVTPCLGLHVYFFSPTMELPGFLLCPISDYSVKCVSMCNKLNSPTCIVSVQIDLYPLQTGK